MRFVSRHVFVVQLHAAQTHRQNGVVRQRSFHLQVVRGAASPRRRSGGRQWQRRRRGAVAATGYRADDGGRRVRRPRNIHAAAAAAAAAASPPVAPGRRRQGDRRPTAVASARLAGRLGDPQLAATPEAQTGGRRQTSTFGRRQGQRRPRAADRVVVDGGRRLAEAHRETRRHAVRRGIYTFYSQFTPPDTTHARHPYTARLKLATSHVLGDPSTDHTQALRSSVAPLPRDWNRRSGLSRQTWLRTVESDVAPLNIGLATAYHRTQNRQTWKSREKRQCPLDKSHDDDTTQLDGRVVSGGVNWLLRNTCTVSPLLEEHNPIGNMARVRGVRTSDSQTSFPRIPAPPQKKNTILDICPPNKCHGFRIRFIVGLGLGTYG